MTIEYAIAYLYKDGTVAQIDPGYKSLKEAQAKQGNLRDFIRPDTKIMRRAVGEWEEA